MARIRAASVSERSVSAPNLSMTTHGGKCCPRKASAAASESIDGVNGSGRFHVRLEPIAVYHINATVEQAADIIF